VRLRVLLVDDHTVVRQGLRRILEADADIQVVGEAGDGRTAAEMAERLRPHVVVMDVSLPELNGIEATRQIVKRSHRTKLLIPSMHLDEGVRAREPKGRPPRLSPEGLRRLRPPEGGEDAGARPVGP